MNIVLYKEKIINTTERYNNSDTLLIKCTFLALYYMQDIFHIDIAYQYTVHLSLPALKDVT